jgi:hypothetical protein
MPSAKSRIICRVLLPNVQRDDDRQEPKRKRMTASSTCRTIHSYGRLFLRLFFSKMRLRPATVSKRDPYFKTYSTRSSTYQTIQIGRITPINPTMCEDHATRVLWPKNPNNPLSSRYQGHQWVTLWLPGKHIWFSRPSASTSCTCLWSHIAIKPPSHFQGRDLDKPQACRRHRQSAPTPRVSPLSHNCRWEPVAPHRRDSPSSTR